MPSSHLILCCPLLLLPSIVPQKWKWRSLSRVQLFVTPWTAAHQASLSITNSWNLLKLMSIQSVIPSNHLILCRPLPTFNLSQHQGLFNESVLHIRWPNYWSFGFSITPSNVCLGSLSFRIDWFDLLAAQGTLRSLSSITVPKASVVHHSAFLTQFSHPYMTTGKTIALTRWTLVSKVMSLLFNMLSSLVTAFLPKSECLLISWLQSSSAVFLEPKKIKSVTAYTFSPSICHEVMASDLSVLNVEF